MRFSPWLNKENHNEQQGIATFRSMYFALDYICISLCGASAEREEVAVDDPCMLSEAKCG